MPPKQSGIGKMGRRCVKHWRVLLSILILMLALIAWMAWQAFGMHVYDSTGYCAPSEVQDYTGVLPPASATHLQSAGWQKGLRVSRFIRFDAPVSDCIAYAQKVLPSAPLNAKNAVTFPPQLIQSEWQILPNCSKWFDLQRATNVIGGSANIAGAVPGPDIWIDQSRGVFYWYIGF